jgi:two-component system, OmpR family, sensor histidine kinase SenX3
MKRTSPPASRSLTVRFLVYFSIAYALIIGVVAWFVLRQPSSRIEGSLILIFVLIGLLGMGIVDIAARRLASPISSLTSQTMALSRGEEIEDLPATGVRELDQLAGSIVELEMQSRNRLDDARVASATLESVLGALPQATILIGGDDTLIYANPATEGLLGAVPASLSSMTPLALQSTVRDCRSSGSQTSTLVERGKPVRKLRGVATPFPDGARVLLVIDDVTELERTAAVRRDFVANASHELKTPVASMIASAEALQIAVDRQDPSSLRFARRIEESAHQLDRLVTDLLDLSRLERDEPVMQPLELDQIVTEEVERIRLIAEEGGIALAAASEPAQVAGSRRDLAVAIRNLLDNAVRHTSSGGSISISVSIEGPEVVMRITDTGEGIPTRDLDRVFERFYRVDDARSRATGGTGLGLAIVKHVVESHGGEVEVESELGVGSTFAVRLPLIDDKTRAGLA